MGRCSAAAGWPTALILTRQGVPAIEREEPFSIEAFNRGAYTVVGGDIADPDVVLVGTGSELQYAFAAKKALKEAGLSARIVSMPSRELFMAQDAAYRRALIPPAARKVVLEAGIAFGWGDVVGPDALMITQDTYGHSAPYKVLMEKLGFNDAAVAARVLAWARGE